MAKISKDEYDVLKGLEDTWKWIARDRDMGSYIFPEGGLWVYEYKPEKPSNFWSMGEDGEEGESVIFPYDDLFQFIQWDDSEPYNIQELIEEYEDENEETEVKSKQELIEKWEMAIESAEFYGRGREDELISYMKDFVSDLKQLEELEVLSQELPVIPEFVAEWIETNRERYENTFFSIGYDLYSNAIHPDVDDWLVENEEKFVRAWLDGFTVEEEQKYIVKLPLPGNKTNDFAVVDIYGDIWLDDEWPSQCKMTEKEIKALPKGEAYFEHFAVKVEEIE